MERLIADANEYERAQGRAGDLTIDSFADQVQAIHDIQEQLGITGTTALEAANTITGSISAARGAWENWLVGLADENADFGQLTQQLLDAIGNVANNVGPRVAVIAQAIIDNLPAAAQAVAQALRAMATDALTTAWNTAADALGRLNIPIPTIDAEQVADAVDAVLALAGDAVSVAADVVRGVADALAAIAGNEGAVTVIAGIAGAFVAVQAAQAAVVVVSAMSAAFTALQTVMAAGAMVQSVQGLGAVLMTLAGGPMVVIPMAIGAMVAAAAYFFTQTEAGRAIAEAAWQAIQTAVSTVAGVVTGAWGAITAATSGAWATVTGTVSGAWAAISGTVSGAVSGIAGTISGTFQGIVGTVSGTFNAIKSAITNAINGAKQVVTNAVNAIKNAFNFSWSLPHLNLPHISVSGGEPPFGIGGMGSLPQFSIEWHAKGGWADGAQLIGVGERGGEFIWPSYQPYIGRYADAIVGAMGGGTSADVVAWLDSKLGATIEAYAPTATPREFDRMVRRAIA